MNKLDLYKCEICGNIVEVILVGGGELVCCGQSMKKLEGKNTETAMMEKHVPILINKEDGTKEVRIGEILHPMTDEHHIMFVETIGKNGAQIQYFTPQDEPKMQVDKSIEISSVRAYCNIHGLWENNFNVL